MKQKSNKTNRKQSLLFLIIFFIGLFWVVLNENSFFSDTLNINETIEIPDYIDQSIVIINNNIPSFTQDELEEAKQSYEDYGALDELGRCSYAIASVSSDTMPTKQREQLKLKPSGWKQAKYEGIIEDDFLYNRCHLIAYCLTGENENECNIITGTHYMNENMNYYEVLVASYLDNHPDYHVLYRATPIFEGNNLLAKGILLEAQSIEEDEISFCVFAYNVEPGIILDYRDGSSSLDPDYQN